MEVEGEGWKGQERWTTVFVIVSEHCMTEEEDAHSQDSEGLIEF